MASEIDKLSEGKVSLTIRIESNGGVSLAELGVLLTGINRALNGYVGDRLAGGMSRATSSKEPLLLSSNVLAIRSGSYVFEVLMNLADFASTQVAQQAFLASILANAGFELSGKLAEQIRKAFVRVNAPGTYVRVEPTFSEPTIAEPTVPERGVSPQADPLPAVDTRDLDRHISITVTVAPQTTAKIEATVPSGASVSLLVRSDR